MHFRSQKKTAGELSLSETIETDRDGNALSLMDVVSVDDDMFERLDLRDSCIRLRREVTKCLEPREAEIIRRRYGLDGAPPQTQREIAHSCGISRSYVSHRR